MFRILFTILILLSSAWADPSRIVSTSPAITEILFSLGLERQIVGVSNFCEFPEQAKKIPKVGSALSLDYEKLVRLNPDLVILSDSSGVRETAKKITDLNLNSLNVVHQDLKDIMNSIRLIGERTGKSFAAKKIIENMQAQLNKLRGKNKNRKFLVVVGHQIKSGKLTDFYVAGSGTHYHDLLSLMGLKNAVTGKGYPQYGQEELYRVDPDIIFDVRPPGSKNLDSVQKAWSEMRQLKALKHKKVHLLDGYYATLPGTLVIKLANKLDQLVNDNAAER